MLCKEIGASTTNLKAQVEIRSCHEQYASGMAACMLRRFSCARLACLLQKT